MQSIEDQMKAYPWAVDEQGVFHIDRIDYEEYLYRQLLRKKREQSEAENDFMNW